MSSNFVHSQSGRRRRYRFGHGMVGVVTTVSLLAVFGSILGPPVASGSDRVVNGGIGVEPEGERPFRPAQVTDLSPCPDYVYQGTWKLEVANMGCTAVPVTPLRRAIDAIVGRVPLPIDEAVEGFGCVVSAGEAAGCRHPDGRGFAVTARNVATTTLVAPPTTRPARTTTTRRRATTTQALPASNDRRSKYCGSVEGAPLNPYPGVRRPSRTWHVRAEATRCNLALRRAVEASGYIGDRHVGRTFDFGPDRCVRSDQERIRCAFNQAGTTEWERYDIGENLQPFYGVPDNVGVYQIYAQQDTRDPSGRYVLTIDAPWVFQWTPPDDWGHEQCLLQGAPFVGAPWEYSAGQVLDSGNRWRMFGFGDCRDVARLTPIVTAPLTRSVPTYESTVEDWRCLTVRNSDFFGAHVISCLRDIDGVIEWFSLYQDTQFNNQLEELLNTTGPFGALALGIQIGQVPERQKGCQPVSSPRRRWKERSRRGVVTEGTSWFMQTVSVPCGYAEVLGMGLTAQGLRLNKKPSEAKRFPGVTCQPVGNATNHHVCTLTNARVFNGRTPKIGVGIYNDVLSNNMTT
jgi:hypothetical protein